MRSKNLPFETQVRLDGAAIRGRSSQATARQEECIPVQLGLVGGLATAGQMKKSQPDILPSATAAEWPFGMKRRRPRRKLYQASRSP